MQSCLGNRVLAILSCSLMLTAPLLLSCSSCPVLAVLFWLFSPFRSALAVYSGSPVLTVMSLKFYHAILFIPVLLSLSCSSCPVPAVLSFSVLFWLSCPKRLILTALFCLSCFTLLSFLSCSACPILPGRFCLSYSACPILSVLFCLSCFGCLFLLSSSFCCTLAVFS
jgi:hypothetical protein